MIQLENISHVYRGLLLRSRAFASFKRDELDIISEDIISQYNDVDEIFDPMSGYGGGMYYFARKGYKTTNVELNPPAYYWQVLINPQNTESIIKIINSILAYRDKWPILHEKFSISDEIFAEPAIKHIRFLYEMILNRSKKNDLLSISILLPFVSRFANYIKSSTNITHFKHGGFCSYVGWDDDFEEYLNILQERLLLDVVNFKESNHKNILSDLMNLDLSDKFKFFVTSPPYPNYRDYSKLFKIENWILDNIIYSKPTDFKYMIGSNNVSGKKFGDIQSNKSNIFLTTLLDKSKKLTKKSRRDIETYYHPYFSQYFYNLQEAYKKLDSLLERNAIGYIVVNDNITRDIIIPVGASICDIFRNLGFDADDIDASQINHFGNIGKMAKRINSQHTRHIIKVCKK
ncbi:MAG: hypothetical protein HOO86_11545 [Bacteroidales bacterium]|nr:hypothetical protein [Bacteroidales bacterium]